MYFFILTRYKLWALHVNVVDMNIDLFIFSAHKFYGPKGVGALYVRKGTKITSFMHGGAQESGRRASTENVAVIVGLGKAIEIATKNIDEYNNKLLLLRERTIDKMMKKVPFCKN